MNKRVTYRYEEVAKKFGVEGEVILEFIEREWLSLSIPETKELDEEDVARAKLILELRDDFGVNDEAVPIILHLIDQLHHFRIRLSSFSETP